MSLLTNPAVPDNGFYTRIRMYLLQMQALPPRMFSSVIGRLENRPEEDQLIGRRNRYAELQSSVTRWHGWLDVLDDLTAPDDLPADTTDAERSALRRFVRALIYFSAGLAMGPRDEDGVPFLTRLQPIWHAEGLEGESRMKMVALEWAREEGLAYDAWCTAMNRAAVMHAGDAPADHVHYVVPEHDEGYISDPDSLPSLESLSGSEF